MKPVMQPIRKRRRYVIMAERKPRATREESLKAKIESNLEAQAKLVAKIEALKVIENGFRKELDDLKNAAKKAEKAKRVATAKKIPFWTISLLPSQLTKSTALFPTI